MIAKGEAISEMHNPFYVYGGNGIGKTHLLSAIANEAVSGEALYFNIADLEVGYDKALKPNKAGMFFRWLQSHDILIIDDIQNCYDNKQLQREIGVTIDRYTSSGRFIVISGDEKPLDLKNIDDWLKSRLAGGITVELKIGSSSERKEIITRSLGEDAIPEDVIDHLASKIDDNIRQLKATAKQVVASCSILDETIDISKADSVINENKRNQSATERFGNEKRNDIRGREMEDLSNDTDIKRAEQFKRMMDDAETEEEQALALQIALGERVRQLREEKNGDPRVLVRLERALELIREGKTEMAIQCMSSKLESTSNVS
jgi:chromosomal replication initiation ATPase DnaA